MKTLEICFAVGVKFSTRVLEDFDYLAIVKHHSLIGRQIDAKVEKNI